MNNLLFKKKMYRPDFRRYIIALALINILLYIGLAIYGALLFFTSYVNGPTREVVYFIMVFVGFVLCIITTVWNCSKYNKEKNLYQPLATN